MTSTPPASAFFIPRGNGRFESTRATVGPWAAHLQHGSPPIALLANAMARHPGGEGKRLARLTVEFLSPVPVAELEIQVEVVRPGAKIELLTGTAKSGDKIVLRATAWRLLASRGRSPNAGTIEAAPPLPGPQELVFFEHLQEFGYGDSLDWRFVTGDFRKLGPATVYTRARIPLIEGEPLTPLDRVLLMLDSANGISAELDPAKWSFVPVDLQTSLLREPAGEWVGMSAATTIESDGIGLSRAMIFDERGEIGRSLHTLFVNAR